MADLTSDLAAWSVPGGPLSGLLLGRVHLPADRDPAGIGGPTPVTIRPDGAYDLLPHGPTVSDLLDRDDLADVLRRPDLVRVAGLDELLAGSPADAADSRFAGSGTPPRIASRRLTRSSMANGFAR